MIKYPRITRKTAEALARRIIGTANGLELETDSCGGRFRLSRGELNVTVENNWFGATDHICVKIAVQSTVLDDSILLLYNRNTLELDDQATEDCRVARLPDFLFDADCSRSGS